MTKIYDAKWVEKFYDDYAELEWDRLVKDPEGEVKLYIHRHYLEKHIQSGDRVLEVGPGPGRFTQILVELGARIVAADISQKQLDLNRQKATELGFDHAVEKYVQLDVCDMSVLEDETFDAVVCYGGPVSYVFEQAGCALDEIKRVIKPGGKALLSVMSLWGTVHRFLDGIFVLPRKVNRLIVDTGDLCVQHLPENKHHCHMFRADELHKLLVDHNLAVLDISASNCVSTVWNEPLIQARQDPSQWKRVLELELEACRQPGCLDMGTHTIAVVRKEINHES